MEKKKKPANFIIPATFFQALMPAKKKEVIEVPKKEFEIPTIVSESIPEKIAESPKPVLEIARKRDSSLSLKSIFQPKEVEKTGIKENYDDYPKTVFTIKKLELYWKEYANLLEKKGEQSMAAIISIGKPVLGENFQISCAVSNSLMQDQFLRTRPNLLHFLREKLNNYGIDILVTLDESISKKFAYTPQEKFNKLKEKNPLIEKLRQTFELDL